MILIRLISVLALAVAVSGVACRKKQVEPTILVVTFDSLRADAVYEHPQDAPNLVSLMAVGARFIRAFAPAPWTLPSLVLAPNWAFAVFPRRPGSEQRLSEQRRKPS